MVYQRIDMVIRHVHRWVFTVFVGSLFPPPAPKLAWSFSVYEPHRPMVCSQLLWEMKPTTGVGYFHGLKNAIQDWMRRSGMFL